VFSQLLVVLFQISVKIIGKILHFGLCGSFHIFEREIYAEVLIFGQTQLFKRQKLCFVNARVAMDNIGDLVEISVVVVYRGDYYLAYGGGNILFV